MYQDHQHSRLSGSIKVLKEKATKENPEKANNKLHNKERHI